MSQFGPSQPPQAYVAPYALTSAVQKAVQPDPSQPPIYQQVGTTPDSGADTASYSPTTDTAQQTVDSSTDSLITDLSTQVTNLTTIVNQLLEATQNNASMATEIQDQLTDMKTNGVPCLLS